MQHSSATDFYQSDVSELKLEQVDLTQNEIDNVERNIDDASLELLVNMAREGELDPWDVDLEKITTRYLELISQQEPGNLKEAGRAIFYASVLLRMKSDMLAQESNDALNIGVHQELDDDYLLQEELEAKNNTQITFSDLEAALRRKYIQKAKRFRKLTLQDLIKSLQDAKEEEDRKIARKQQQLLNLQDYEIVAPELGDDIMDLVHAENLEDAIERLDAILPEHLFEDKFLEFKEVVKLLGNWSNAFLACIFLAHEAKVDLKQDKFYEDLFLYGTE